MYYSLLPETRLFYSLMEMPKLTVDIADVNLVETFTRYMPVVIITMMIVINIIIYLFEKKHSAEHCTAACQNMSHQF